jgi:hypothetical protein
MLPLLRRSISSPNFWRGASLPHPNHSTAFYPEDHASISLAFVQRNQSLTVQSSPLGATASDILPAIVPFVYGMDTFTVLWQEVPCALRVLRKDLIFRHPAKGPEIMTGHIVRDRR